MYNVHFIYGTVHVLLSGISVQCSLTLYLCMRTFICIPTCVYGLVLMCRDLQFCLCLQVGIRRLGPGFVQQYTQRCDVCRGRGEIISGEPLPLEYRMIIYM